MSLRMMDIGDGTYRLISAGAPFDLRLGGFREHKELFKRQ
jgi:hypothetical protein